MTATLVDLATEMVNKITAFRDGPTAWWSGSRWDGETGFAVNTFEIERSFLPYQRLTELALKTGGKVWVVGLAGEEMPNKTRSNLAIKNVPIQIGFQKVLSDVSDVTEIDPLVKTAEQLQDIARYLVNDDTNPYSWMSNEPLADEHGTPYAFTGLREQDTFEWYFTANYQLVIQ